MLGSPPLARGVRPADRHLDLRLGITPACAGSTLQIGPRMDGKWDHPRLRGEYERDAYYERRRRGSPPLARGVLPL